MITIPAKAYAKINISLDILGAREDGFHEMEMVMNQINLSDDIRIYQGTGQEDKILTNVRYLPKDGKNIALKAAHAFFDEIGMDPDGLCIEIKKKIPVSAGLAGGSTDGAAVFKALMQKYPDSIPEDRVHEILTELGSDIPYCYKGGTMLATGRGEILSPLPALPKTWCVLVKPSFSLSTKMMFEKIEEEPIWKHPDTQGIIQALTNGDIRGVSSLMFNVFEQYLGFRGDKINAIKEILLEGGAYGAVMSGSGPSVFGFFEDREEAEIASESLSREYHDVFVVDTL